MKLSRSLRDTRRLNQTKLIPAAALLAALALGGCAASAPSGSPNTPEYNKPSSTGSPATGTSPAPTR